jgi:DNA polymerase III sliding clamp (beta) subunit (PCNA family)
VKIFRRCLNPQHADRGARGSAVKEMVAKTKFAITGEDTQLPERRAVRAQARGDEPAAIDGHRLALAA